MDDERKEKNHIKKTLLFIIISVVVFCVFQFIKPWVKPNAMVRNDILELIPIGTSWDDVVEIIESKEDWYIPTHIGLVHWSSLSKSDIQIPNIIERKGINLSIKDYGHAVYHAFFQVNVTLRFDEDYNLSEVEVTRLLSI
ncbi:MAG: hypothetical protein FWG70_10840 [Oscillospiraceae bacterium]|nr:hypothetical protein [Oscillospiraceae bacterium]